MRPVIVPVPQPVRRANQIAEEFLREWNCDDSTRRSRGTVRCSFVLAYLDSWPMRTVAENCHEMQTFLEDDWMEQSYLKLSLLRLIAVSALISVNPSQPLSELIGLRQKCTHALTETDQSTGIITEMHVRWMCIHETPTLRCPPNLNQLGFWRVSDQSHGSGDSFCLRFILLTSARELRSIRLLLSFACRFSECQTA